MCLNTRSYSPYSQLNLYQLNIYVPEKDTLCPTNKKTYLENVQRPDSIES